MIERLINIEGLGDMDAKQLASSLKDWFIENGTIAFEHGFIPRFNMQMISGNGVYQYGGRVNFDKFDRDQLLTIISECERYYQYCLHEA